jgi:GxxExxY protein
MQGDGPVTSRSRLSGTELAEIDEVTERVIGAGIEVHRELGPRLLEGAYEECLAREFALRRIPFERQKLIALTYKGVQTDVGFRADFVVANKVMVELKSVDSLEPIHEAQVLTYLKLTGLRVGLLINFNARVLARGIRRLAL